MIAKRLNALRQTKFYDLFAAAPLIAWYAFCAARLLPLVSQQIDLVKLFLQTDPSALPMVLILRTCANVGTLAFFAILIVMFVVRYVPQRTTQRLHERCVAVAGTFLGVGILLLPPQELSSSLYLISLVLIIAGTVLAIYATLVLGRSISILPEARRLVVRGPYALVRHPLYLGEIVAVAGVALQYFSIWALLLVVVQTVLQLLRMNYEERVLSQVFPEYKSYIARTARLMPGIY